MPNYKKDPNYEKVFEGSKKALRKYHEDVYLETVDNWFGPIDKLKIGAQIEDIFCNSIIKRKSKNLYVMFNMKLESSTVK